MGSSSLFCLLACFMLIDRAILMRVRKVQLSSDNASALVVNSSTELHVEKLMALTSNMNAYDGPVLHVKSCWNFSEDQLGEEFSSRIINTDEPFSCGGHNLLFTKRIASGTMAVVLQATEVPKGEGGDGGSQNNVAVKINKVKLYNEEEREEYKRRRRVVYDIGRECEMMKKAEAGGVQTPACHASCIGYGHEILVMDLLENSMESRQWFDANVGVVSQATKVDEAASNIVKNLYRMIAMGMINFDQFFRNIMISPDGIVDFIDLGDSFTKDEMGRNFDFGNAVNEFVGTVLDTITVSALRKAVAANTEELEKIKDEDVRHWVTRQTEAHIAKRHGLLYRAGRKIIKRVEPYFRKTTRGRASC